MPDCPLMSSADKKGDPFARFYHQNADDPAHWRLMFEQIGRIIVAWGAAENALAKLWWHMAFNAGKELSRNKVYIAPIAEKLKELRKLVPYDGSRTDMQLARVEAVMPDLELDRHALVHGYLSMTAKGPAVLNLRNDRLAFAIDLPGFLAWAIFLADVAHQLYEEATVHIYHGQDRILLPDPIQPAPYERSILSGWPEQR